MALKHLVLGGKNIAYRDTGAGAETVILVHCSGASHRIFNKLIDTLSEHYRVLAPDLAGYGASEAWPANEAFHYSFDVNIIKRLLAMSPNPTHIVGYSYGGFLALEAALSAQPIRSLVLLEPVALQLLRNNDNPRLLKEVDAMGERLMKFAKRGQTRRAAGAYMSYWAGPLRWLLTPGKTKSVVQNTVHKTAMEFSSGYDAATEPDHYESIQCPVLLIGGSRTRDLAKAVLAILSQALTRSQCVWLKGASHLTLLRDSSVNGLILHWLQETASMTPASRAQPVDDALVPADATL